MNEVADSSALDKSFSRLFRRELLRWFDCNKRSLPWRVDHDPYHVWVSEIMLQQTRVAAVVDYYQRFMQRFPDVHTLSRAREASVLAAWSGLGYYHRARSLHQTAKIIVADFGGSFPRNAKKLQDLPGIGRYTAAAIASIAFGEKRAVVDGNVERVLGRVMGSTLSGPTNGTQSREQVWASAQQLLSPVRPGDFNEAIMELGAVVCVPGEPACVTCPVVRLCVTRGRGTRAGTEFRKKRPLTCLLSTNRQSVYLVRRPRSASLMAGMWELPRTQNEFAGDLLFRLRHSITNTDYSITVLSARETAIVGGEWVPWKRASRLPLTGLARKILRKANIIE